MTPRLRPKHSHHDAPDTAEAFLRLRTLPPGPERERLMGEIVTAWLPMAHRLALRYRSSGEPRDDLHQVAALGLVKAVDRYDPTVSPAFATFAVPTIDGELRRHLRDFTSLVHVPRRLQEVRDRVRAVLGEAGCEPGDTGAPAVIAKLTGLTEQEAVAGLEALRSGSALSLDAAGLTDTAARPLLESIGAVDERLRTVEEREAARPLLRSLPERERTILYLRFFEDRPQREIADRYGISQVHVSRLIRDTCRYVRRHVEREEPDPPEEGAPAT
ncbi:sigma-70 family RNA polymerase sigma factor [Phaeacidiphilus oryzae]|uniref:sigma-70 family RNA polymerase sigma factor n=1 Tax=Phaeacidiphilus oryzae TaxID=348818 RepID=UPI00068B757B|nr:sigma-70 family RNA polymerase sigma factor [Phaeacidiphilus oryzae]